MTHLTRKEAVNAVGQALVEEAEACDVDFTSRVTEGTSNQGLTEFSGSVDCDDTTLTMYVYVDNDIVKQVEQLDQINWDEAIAQAVFCIE